MRALKWRASGRWSHTMVLYLFGIPVWIIDSADYRDGG